MESENDVLAPAPIKHFLPSSPNCTCNSETIIAKLNNLQYLITQQHIQIKQQVTEQHQEILHHQNQHVHTNKQIVIIMKMTHLNAEIFLEQFLQQSQQD